jgi:carboxypeptidase PM20D1
MTQPVLDLLAVFRRYLPWWKGTIYRFHRAFRPLVFLLLSRRPETDALVRTTQATTVVQGSTQASLLPASARAIVNVRILPGETVTGTVDRLQAIVRPLGVAVRLVDEWDATEPVYSRDYRSSGYRRVCETVGRVIPEVVCAPFLVSGSTDSRYYHDLTQAVLRLSPIVLRLSELQTIHGVNERISFGNVSRCLQFYAALIRDSCG